MSCIKNVDVFLGNSCCFGLRQPLQAVVGMNCCVCHLFVLLSANLFVIINH